MSQGMLTFSFRILVLCQGPAFAFHQSRCVCIPVAMFVKPVGKKVKGIAHDR